MNKNKIRLNKYISNAGYTSRRKADQLISAGSVKVNGRIVTELGMRVDEQDLVEIDGRVLDIPDEKTYILLNKPEGYVCTLDDEKDRKIITDLIRNKKERLYPVGRLDMASSGLIILTNDGELAHRLTHPSHEVEKEYLVKIDGRAEETDISKLQSGVLVEGHLVSAKRARIVSQNSRNTYILVVLTEGRNREIRKMLAAMGYDVLKLKRIRIAELLIDGLGKGEYRHLTAREVENLKMQ